MRFNDYDSLIEFLVERKINEISYGGIRDIGGFLKDRIGIDLWESDEEGTLLNISVELRNVYTHNRGVVNDVFLKKTRGLTHPFSIKAGERFHADFDEIALLANNMFALSSRLDARVAQKYTLNRQNIRYGINPKRTIKDTHSCNHTNTEPFGFSTTSAGRRSNIARSFYDSAPRPWLAHRGRKPQMRETDHGGRDTSGRPLRRRIVQPPAHNPITQPPPAPGRR